MDTSLTIITACLPSKADHLSETAASIGEARDAFLAAGVALDWIVVYDGEAEAGQAVGAEEIFLHTHCGVSVARNVGLANATGKYVMPLDADDVLVPEGVINAILKLEKKRDYAWAAGNRTFMDGTKTRHWHGRSSWGAKYLAWDWTSPFPFHTSTVVVDRSVALDIGGWPALPACEDVGFILEISERRGGFAMEDVFLRYRSWHKQTARTRGYLEQKALSYRCIEALINNNRLHSGDPLIEGPQLLPDAPLD